MEWFNEMLILSNCSPEHASLATAVVAVLITIYIIKAIFCAIFPKR